MIRALAQILALVLLVVFLEAARRARVPGLVVYSPVFSEETVVVSEKAALLPKALKRASLNFSVLYSLAARLKVKELDLAAALDSCSLDWVWAT